MGRLIKCRLFWHGYLDPGTPHQPIQDSFKIAVSSEVFLHNPFLAHLLSQVADLYHSLFSLPTHSPSLSISEREWVIIEPYNYTPVSHSNTIFYKLLKGSLKFSCFRPIFLFNSLRRRIRTGWPPEQASSRNTLIALVPNGCLLKHHRRDLEDSSRLIPANKVRHHWPRTMRTGI